MTLTFVWRLYQGQVHHCVTFLISRKPLEIAIDIQGFNLLSTIFFISFT